MNLETTASNLRSALGALNGIVERRNSIPVLGTVKIAGGKLTATNLDIEATVTIPTTGKMTGSAAVDYFRMAALSKHIQPDEAIKVDTDNGLASIGFNGSRYTIPSLSIGDFPEFGEVVGERSDIGNAGLIAAFRRVRFAVSTEPTRYYLNGVALVENAEGAGFAAATDGHRLALQPIPFMPAGGKGQIIPRGLVSYLCGRKIEPKAVTFASGKPNARLDFDGLSVSAKLIDGTYPDIWRVIPKEPVHYFSADREKLLAVLRRMAAFAGNSAHDHRGVKLTGNGDRLTLALGKNETTANEVIEAECTSVFEVGYNFRYLIEILSVLSGETVSFGSEKGAISGAPAIITSNDDPLRIVLMPMRV